MAYPTPHQPFTHDHMSPQSGHGSFNDRMSFQNFARDPSDHSAQSAPMGLVDLWSFEPPACGSPLSTCSSISHAESMHTPPYAGLPMYDVLEPGFPHTQASLANNGTCTSGSETFWPSNYPETAPWDSQPFVLPCQNVPNYEQPSFELAQSFEAQPQGTAPAPYLTYAESLPYHMEQTVDSATVEAEALGNNGGDSDELSDSDSGDSDSDDYDGSDSSTVSLRAFSRRPQVNANVFRVEGWTTNIPTFNTTPERRNTCPVPVGPNRDTPCTKHFLRQEHLRRHIRTVHGIGLHKVNYCKVPSCGARFPRSDNFRQHYLTHLTKGKRKGNNEKMSFQRLKEILGPQEKQLQRWLKSRLRQS